MGGLDDGPTGSIMRWMCSFLVSVLSAEVALTSSAAPLSDGNHTSDRVVRSRSRRKNGIINFFARQNDNTSIGRHRRV